MKRFQYRLQTKLDVTLSQEEAAKKDLAEHRHRYYNQLARLEEMQQELGYLYQRIRTRNSQVVDMGEVTLVKNYLPVLRERIARQMEHVRLLHVEMDRAYNKLVEIMRERKALENLKEKEWREYLEEFNRQEQLQIDEVALTGYWRANRDGTA